jgi:hypothetical protein
MPGSSPSTLTFYVTSEARELIETLSSEFGQNMGQVSAAALGYYRNLIDAGEASKPEAARIGSELGAGQGSRRVIIPGQSDIGQWLAHVSDDWGTSRGLVLMKAVEYYSAAIESGRIPRPVKRETPKKTSSSRPKTRPSASLVKPTGKPLAVDRAQCGTCHKQVGIHAETSLLVDHVAHPSVRPKGKYVLCEGSGQAPDGPIIHSAEIVTSTRRPV